MKKVLLLLLYIALSFVTVKANDTLTRAQVYNFNVGDTFDFKYNTDYVDWNYHNTNYGRKVLMQKTYTPNFDTLYLGYSSPGGSIFEWDTITNIDSVAVFNIPNVDTLCNLNYTFDTTSYPGFHSNSVDIMCFESGSSYRFTEGMGRTMYSYGQIGMNGFGCNCYGEELIYYSNGTFALGTPYNVMNGSAVIKYLPLPEECAIWTRKVTGSYTAPGFTPPYGTVIEQIRTGNKIYKSGRNYVELICRIQNDITNHFTPDSLLGYFYNDTITHTASFVSDTNSNNPSLIYSCNTLSGEQCTYNGRWDIDSTMIDGTYRTSWVCYSSGGQPPYGSYCSGTTTIAGIGKLSGLMSINRLWMYGYESCGTLTSFCVCGEKLFGTDTSVSCDLLSSLEEIRNPNSAIRIAPNPATTYLTIQSNQNISSPTVFQLYDITGRMILQKPITAQTTRVELSDVSKGMYLYNIVSEKEKVGAGKLIIE